MSGAVTPLERLALDLLSIPSVIGSERALADHVEAWARPRAFARLVRAGDNLVLVPHARRTVRPYVLLAGHLDTVPAADENPPRIDGERIFGLGASDMKCADALILHLLARATQEAPAVDLAAVLYAREEGPYDQSGLPEALAAAPEVFEGVDLAIALEPTDNHIELGCLGTLHANVRFVGVSAHSARPWEGRNAIHMAAPFLSRVASLAPRACTYAGLAFREVCSVTMLAYEGARNVVPRACDVNVNLRFAPDRTPAEAVAWVEDLVRDSVGADALADGRVQVEVRDLCPSGRVCADNALLGSLRAAWPGAQTRAKQAWTDVGRFSALGIDALNLGPGSGAEAHQRGESCLRRNLEEARAHFEGWLWP